MAREADPVPEPLPDGEPRRPESGAAGELGTAAATALVVGHTVAVGIFLTPAQVIGALRSPALILGLWVGCGLLVLAGALTFGELATRYPQAGGPYVFLREAWGDRAAFLYGWQALLVMDPGVTAALAAGLSQYLVVAWPGARGAESWLSVGVIWTLAAVAMAGLRPSVRVVGGLTALKVAALTLVVLVAFARGDGSWANLSPFLGSQSGASPGTGALAGALVGIFFSFGGFWEASRVAGEVRDRRRTLPWALGLGVAAVSVVYVATTVAFMYLVPAEATTSPTEFAERAGVAMFGPSGPVVLAGVVVLSVAASLIALFIMVPRVYVAMERDGVLPGAVVSAGSTSGTPARGMALLASLASVYALVGTFEQIVAFFLCTAMGFVALAAAALPVVRRLDPVGSGFRSPGHPLTSLLFVLLVVAVVVLVAVSRPLQAIIGFAVVLLGIPVHALTLRKRDRARSRARRKSGP